MRLVIQRWNAGWRAEKQRKTPAAVSLSYDYRRQQAETRVSPWWRQSADGMKRAYMYVPPHSAVRHHDRAACGGNTRGRFQGTDSVG